MSHLARMQTLPFTLDGVKNWLFTLKPQKSGVKSITKLIKLQLDVID